MHSFDAGNFAGKQGRHCIGMPASDPSDEARIVEMAHNTTAEKSGAAKYGHAQSHDAKVSPQLRLSQSHSTGGQSRHRAEASQTLVSRQGMSSVDTSFIESTVVYNVRQPGSLLPEAGRRSFYSEVRLRRVAPSPSPVWRRAFRRALRCGQPACAWKWRRRHGSGERPCMQR